MSFLIATFSLARDRLESPLYGDTDRSLPWLYFALTVMLAFIWMRVLRYAE